MPRLNEVYLSQSQIHELNEEFYRSYDEDHWNVKIEMYDYLLENIEDVFINQNEEFYKSCRRQVRAEFVYMFYHSVEALFGLVRSLTKDGIPWIDLKETYSGDITAFVENELQEDGFNEELRDVFYPSANPTDNQEQKIQESIEVVWDYLKYAGKRYSDRTVYNEYKHGLRLVTRESKIEMEIEDKELDEFVVSEYDNVEETDDGLVWNMLNGDVLFYLDASVWQRDDTSGKKYWSLSRKMKSLEFGLFRRLCSFNADLVSQIFSVRRDLLDIDPNEQTVSTMTLWNDVDLQAMLMPESPLQSFSVDLYHPRSEKDILEYEIG